MADVLGDDVVAALTEMVRTADELPGQYGVEFSVTYWAGVVPPHDCWVCTVEGDIHGDDGDQFSVFARTLAEVLRRAAAETWRRVPPQELT
jgi:hypothetical protein